MLQNHLHGNEQHLKKLMLMNAFQTSYKVLSEKVKARILRVPFMKIQSSTQPLVILPVILQYANA